MIWKIVLSIKLKGLGKDKKGKFIKNENRLLIIREN